MGGDRVLETDCRSPNRKNQDEILRGRISRETRGSTLEAGSTPGPDWVWTRFRLGLGKVATLCVVRVCCLRQGNAAAMREMLLGCRYGIRQVGEMHRAAIDGLSVTTPNMTDYNHLVMHGKGYHSQRR